MAPPNAPAEAVTFFRSYLGIALEIFADDPQSTASYAGERPKVL